MTVKQQSNILKSTYKGLFVLTIILITIFTFKTLLFSYEIHSYDETDKKFEANKLFTKNDTSKTKNSSQKNIIKDLTLNQKIVNINSSLKDELVKLPGIGPKTAEKIINYRTTNGDFQTKNDLKKVKGIGSAKLKTIENLIKLK